MHDLQWYDFIRFFNAGFSCWSVYCLGRIHNRGNLDDGVLNNEKRMRDFWWSLTAILLTTAVGNIEQVLRNRPVTLSLVASFVALLVFARTLRKTRRMMENGHSSG